MIFILLSLLNVYIRAEHNKVDNLFGDLYSGDIYSGYLKTKIDGNELFYIYTPSQNNPNTAPVLVWLNGGPGCSSLFGMLAEVGPVTSDNYANEFKKNPFSWNINANLIAIEQPAGVGFSKTNDLHFRWTDDLTAENLLYGIKDFLNEFNLKGRDFYISGESYAGIYIPFLAKHMLEDSSSDKVNLKGILIGNGLTDFDTDIERSMVEFGFYHGLISLETYNIFKRHCPHKPDELVPEEDDNYQNEEFKDKYYPKNVTHKCNEIRNIIWENLGGSDIYGVYRLCPTESRFSLNDPFYLNNKNSMRKTILKKLNQYKNKQYELENIYFDQLEPENDVWPVKCGEDLTFDKFLNDPVTKKKLAVYNQSMTWTQCFDINYEMSSSFSFYSETMLKFPNLKVWLFSGTEDGVVPTLGTLRWINKLGFNPEIKWRQWKVNNQVAGYVQKYYEGLVFVTVKGAGHMVPQDQRESAFKLVSSFLNGVLP